MQTAAAQKSSTSDDTQFAQVSMRQQNGKMLPTEYRKGPGQCQASNIRFAQVNLFVALLRATESHCDIRANARDTIENTTVIPILIELIFWLALFPNHCTLSGLSEKKKGKKKKRSKNPDKQSETCAALNANARLTTIGGHTTEIGEVVIKIKFILLCNEVNGQTESGAILVVNRQMPLNFSIAYENEFDRNLIWSSSFFI